MNYGIELIDDYIGSFIRTCLKSGMSQQEAKTALLNDECYQATQRALINIEQVKPRVVMTVDVKDYDQYYSHLMSSVVKQKG